MNHISHVIFSEVNFQLLPCCGGDRTLRTGMAVVQVKRLNVVYHRDLRLSCVRTFCALPGIGTFLLQQLLDSILDFFFDFLRYQISPRVHHRHFTLCLLWVNDSLLFFLVIEPGSSSVTVAAILL